MEAGDGVIQALPILTVARPNGSIYAQYTMLGDRRSTEIAHGLIQREGFGKGTVHWTKIYGGQVSQLAAK
ncbi:hypothetical protein IQ219_17385 [Synechocystis sp. LEGE 06083]|uniref:hypothetical protein n=1 Tax=Synechocystis sp. LEGE 06083 TaxID=915336 RepID=UPI0018803FC8|nr:hypothetical protein [Synechocystis sp. LEGE 06083]MBE9197037.1 hypothetical protein [Synechocystis sp. LEGE 06083]